MIKELICIMLCTTAFSESPVADRKTIHYKGGSITFVATPEETVRTIIAVGPSHLKRVVERANTMLAQVPNS